MKKLKFLHITKCGGTTIENIAFKRNIKWGRFDTDLPFWHYPLNQMPLRLLLDFDWFVIVRHPLTRLLSEFYCEWGGPSKKIQTIEDFNAFLIEELNLIQKDPWLRHGHYTPQYLYIEGLTNIKILHLEDLQNQFQNLMVEYGLEEIKIDDKKDNESKNNKFSIQDFSQELIELVKTIYANDFKIFKYQI